MRLLVTFECSKIIASHLPWEGLPRASLQSTVLADLAGTSRCLAGGQ